MASLKHLRRQNSALTDDKDRLQAEVLRLQALLRQQEKAKDMEAATAGGNSMPEPSESSTCARDEQREEAWASVESQLRAKIAALEDERQLLEHTLDRRDKEVGRLKYSLEQQNDSTKDQREANERQKEHEERALRKAAGLAERVQQLERELIKLTGQNSDLEGQKGELAEQLRKSQDEVSESVAKVEVLTKVHEDHKHLTEQMRSGLVGSAIQSKLELHISVPHVVLTYNNAPPLTVSTAIGLSKAKILKFLDGMLFPHFEPMWVCLDGVDKAPDGTNKKKYSSRMLERLTDSVKEFIEKSQLGEGTAELSSSDAKKDEVRRPGSRSSIRSGFKGLGSLRTPEKAGLS